MKTLGLCFLFLSFVLLINIPAQAQSDGLALNINKDATQKWMARKGQSGQGYQVLLPPQDNKFEFQPMSWSRVACTCGRIA